MRTVQSNKENTNDTNKIRVIVVDDQNLYLEAIGEKIGNSDGIEVVGMCETGAEAHALSKKHKPDIVLLDYHLPDHGGLEVLKRIKSVSKNTKVIFVTSSQDVEVLFRISKSDASGLITKGSRYSVIEAIKGVYKGDEYIQPDLGSFLLSYLSKRESASKVSDRDYQIKQLADNGMKAGPISEKYNLSEKRVRNIIAEVKSKCGYLDTDLASHMAN